MVKWTPKQAAATAEADAHRYTLFGGARGPGKSYWLRWYLLRYLLQCARHNLRHVHVGLFCEDYPQLKDRQISKIEMEFPRWLGILQESRHSGLGFHLKPEYGGGVMALRNLDDPSKYQSAEFAAIGVDELTKNPVSTFDVLRGSLRWPGIRNVRFVAASNPGGIGHLWVKAYWIDRTYPPEMERMANEFSFVRALPDDNPHLDQAYWSMLDTLPRDLARAWRWGEWDVFAGQVFGEWRRDRHVVLPYDIPEHWTRLRAVDWGRHSPWCCLWMARNPDSGRVVVYREAYETGLTDRQQAQRILDMTPPGERISMTYADPSMWTKKTFEDQTFSTADEYGSGGVHVTKADNDRLNGVRKVHTLLADLGDGLPGLQIFETCPNLIRTLPALVRDAVRSEDVDTDAEDHCYDALRYGLTAVRPARVRAAAPAANLRVGRVVVRELGGLVSKDL
jgi:hypothetical protein